MADASGTPALAEFAARRFAVRSPWVSWTLFERVGGVVAYLFARIGLSPSLTTVTGGCVGVWGATLLAVATDRADALVALAVLLLSYVLDCADGQLARATGRTSAMGAWLDVAVDAVVVAFVSVALCMALVTQNSGSVMSLLLAGAYGASRTVSLMTSARIAASGAGGLGLTGVRQFLRVGFVAAIDTPVVYVALCASRLTPGLFRAVIVVVSLMTVAQTLISARHHFAVVAERSPG